MSGFGLTADYVVARDSLRFESLCFWLKNGTGVPFSLKLEIEDYHDSSGDSRHRQSDIPETMLGRRC